MLSSLKRNLYSYVKEQKLHPSLPGNFTLPSSSYISRDIFIKEIQCLNEYPKVLCDVEGLKSRSEYLLGGTEKDPRLYHNACPHRGARLESHENGFRCKYHGWDFDLEGKLSKSTGHVCPYKQGRLGLKELKGSALGGMFFLGDAPEGKFIEEIRYLSKGSNFLQQTNNKIKCNWKFVVESLLETYHFPFAHQKILGNFEHAFYSMSEQEDLNSRILVPLDDLESGVNEDNLKGMNVMYFIFPFTFVLFMSSGYVWFEISPVDEASSILKRSLFSVKPQVEGARKSMEILDEILKDDFAVLESQQENALVFQKHFLTGYEVTLKSFHESLNRILSISRPITAIYS